MCLCRPLWVSPWLHVDISISLLAVVVGFCGLALLVVSLFVFWKLCWPIWRSKSLSAHVENGLHVGFPEVPPSNSPPATECKAGEMEKKYPLEVKMNGRSSVKLLEAAMKISQTSPDIPAEVQTALREKLSQQAKIQRQTTEPTSSSRYPTWTHCSQNPSLHWGHNNDDKLFIHMKLLLTITVQWQHLWTHFGSFPPSVLDTKLMLTQRKNCPDSLWQSSHCPWGGLARVRASGTGCWPWNAVAHVKLWVSGTVWPGKKKSPPVGSSVRAAVHLLASLWTL